MPWIAYLLLFSDTVARSLLVDTKIDCARSRRKSDATSQFLASFRLSSLVRSSSRVRIKKSRFLETFVEGFFLAAHKPFGNGVCNLSVLHLVIWHFHGRTEIVLSRIFRANLRASSCLLLSRLKICLGNAVLTRHYSIFESRALRPIQPYNLVGVLRYFQDDPQTL